MIEVAHLYRRYGQVVAVEDLSFRLEKGEVVGFLGPNGAGKTTTMRILAGYLPASKADRVQVAGFDVLRQSIEVRKRIGYLPESVPLYRELRVREMLRFHGRLHAMERSELARAIPRVLERVGVLERSEQLVGNLSRGLRQRVGLAVALLPNPDVLILDEPTSGLDPLQRREVRALVGELAKEHTVLLSSHILAEIELVCPRVIILDRGRLLADGSQEALLGQLAGAQTVRVEAMCGPDAEAAHRLLASLPGVSGVQIGERLGIHQTFVVRGEGDLREDVGALAMQKGWALRELSRSRPTLEEVFSKLVLGDLSQDPPHDPPNTPSVPPGDKPASMVQLGLPGRPLAATPPPKKGAIYSLNPFDRGAERDLSKPVAREPQTPDLEAPCDPEPGPMAPSGEEDPRS